MWSPEHTPCYIRTLVISLPDASPIPEGVKKADLPHAGPVLHEHKWRAASNKVSWEGGDGGEWGIWQISYR